MKRQYILVLGIIALFAFNSSVMIGDGATVETEFFPDVTLTTTATITLDNDAILALGLDVRALRATEHISNIRITDKGIQMDIHSEMVISSSDVEKVNVEMTDSAEEAVSSWQVERMLDKPTSEYFENTTDQTDAYEIANNFNSGTYQYLAIKKARSSSTSNTVIIVSYSDALTGNITAGADTTNTTILNKFLPVQQFMFFRLDREATNTTRPYIIHIEFDELVCDAIQIFDLPSAQNFTDERYSEIYMGSRTTAENNSAYALTATWEQIMAHGTDYQENWADNVVKGVGFKTADAFEDALYATWVKILNNELSKDMHYRSIDVGDIDDYTLDLMRLNTIIDGTASQELYDIFEQRLDTVSAIKTCLDEVKEDTIRKFTITSNIIPTVLTEDEDAEQITDLSNAILASAERAEGKATSFSTNILDKFIDATGKINEPLAVFMAKVRESAGVYVSDNWILIIILGSAGIISALTITIIALAVRAKKK